MTSIQWTDETWNPTVGCSRVSAGCEHCYAEGVAHRAMQKAHKGLTVLGKHGPRWTGEVRLLPERLSAPLHWKKPRRVFVDSMSDLFHEDVPFEFIAAVYGVMWACPQHTFQVLTKRIERALLFYKWLGCAVGINHQTGERSQLKTDPLTGCIIKAGKHVKLGPYRLGERSGWPLNNVWLGTSCEDQPAANKRVHVLQQCPAAVRFVSAEPLLGPLDLRNGRENRWSLPTKTDSNGHGIEWTDPGENYIPLDWVIVGGESGPGARPCNIEWIHAIVHQCHEAGVPAFVKQLGAHPFADEGSLAARNWVFCAGRMDDLGGIHLRDRKGGDLAEWPANLRVREFPQA